MFPDEAIDYLLITHCHFDHTGGAAELKERLNLKVVAHVRDAEFLENGDQEVTAASWYGAGAGTGSGGHQAQRDPGRRFAWATVKSSPFMCLGTPPGPWCTR